MSEQPEALRLADALEKHIVYPKKEKTAAALIRRQHARIEADEALMQTMLDALESCDPGDCSTGHVIHASYNEQMIEAAITALRSRLETK